VADRRRRAPLVRQIMALDWSWRDPATRYIQEYGRVRDLHAGPAGRE
jgi:hypothetical protein